jgi:ribonuclease HIII
MASIAVQVNPNTIPKIYDALIHRADQERNPTNRYEVFRLQVNTGYIIAYTSGRIVATNQEAHKLLKEVLHSVETQQADQVLIGSDEAGKGELLGPLVIAAVAISPNSIAEIRSTGVMDSKELSVRRINELAPQIERSIITSETILVSPKRFNQMFQEFKQKGKGLNDILAWAHCKAIKTVYDVISNQKKPIKITIDEFDRAKTAKCLAELEKVPNVTIIQKIHAEEEIEVACASILARAERERWITEKSKELNVDLRAISKEEVRNMERRDEFFKTGYKSRG